MCSSFTAIPIPNSCWVDASTGPEIRINSVELELNLTIYSPPVPKNVWVFALALPVEATAL